MEEGRGAREPVVLPLHDGLAAGEQQAREEHVRAERPDGDQDVGDVDGLGGGRAPAGASAAQ